MNAHKQCLMAAAQMISQGGSIQLPDMHSTTHNPAQKSMPKDLLSKAQGASTARLRSALFMLRPLCCQPAF
eukprot:scaffold48125_cov15-Tisochrysis_lutea.AAC.2